MDSGRRLYAVAALAVFAVEVAIALFVRDRLVRPLLGDTLAVVLVYLTLRAVTRLRVTPAAVLALGIAFAVEFAQLLEIVDLLGLGDNRIARTVLGASFDPLDLVAYTAGAALILAAEALARRRRPTAPPR